MKILILSTLKRKVAENEFASRSRIIYQLARGLVSRGHEVSLLGTGDSIIEGVKIISIIPSGWVDLPPVENPFIRETATLIQQAKIMLSLQKDFDIIHNHTYPDIFPHIVDEQLDIPLVTTLHAVAADYLDDAMGLFHNSHFIALSKAYRNLLKKTSVHAVVYNGIDTSVYQFKEKKGDYLLWIGRINGSKNEDGTYIDPKGVGWAIQLAQKTGTPLKMIGDVLDNEAFAKEVEPYLSNTIEWVSKKVSQQSLSKEDVVNYMQNAKALLMTVNQEEPFGLVMAESMSCGTPVIGFNKGAVIEVVKDGETGFVVDVEEGVDGLARALEKIPSILPSQCRKRVEDHFSVDVMVENYEKIYEELICASK
ncbi:MAG: glycosyltransferase family 4 protein [Candidatus Levybacteria bacterium]|nr:glycosyltransferase family 4 protein [Candidatus Levybacteria bacterium]